MKNRITSLNGAIAVSVIALLTFLGRAFMDWRYEYPQQDPAGNWDTPMALIYMALIGVWLWVLLAASRGGRRGLIGFWSQSCCWMLGLHWPHTSFSARPGPIARVGSTRGYGTG